MSLLLFLALFPAKALADGDTALIIIDMQDYFATRGGHADDPNNAEIIRRIHAAQVEAIRAARARHMPIVFIEYSDSGVTNHVLTDAARGYSPQATITKDTDGMFDEYNGHRQELVDYLQRQHVHNLVITGANGGACVQASIQGAIANNYSVTAYSGGIADFNYDEFIYPYTHYGYTNSCPSCTFRDVDTLDEAIPPPAAAAGHKTTGTHSSVHDSSGGPGPADTGQHGTEDRASGTCHVPFDSNLEGVGRFCHDVNGAMESK